MRGYSASPIALALAVSAGLHVAVLGLPNLRTVFSRGRPPESRMKVTLLESAPQRKPAHDDPPPNTSAGGGSSAADAPLSLDTADPRYQGYFQVLKGMIARRWIYPQEARALRQRGKVLLEFTLDPRGGVRRVRVSGSSGTPSLDAAAMAAVHQAAPYPPCPAGIRRDPFTVSALFVYGG